MSRPSPSPTTPVAPRPRRARWAVGAVSAAVALAGLGAAPATAAPGASPSAVGDTSLGLFEVEDGAISGGPALNSGEHGNFSGTGSYTFREAGMRSAINVAAPEAGTYPVYIRYAAGPLNPEENNRAMGLVTNGVRQVVPYPLTGDWETWRVAQATVNLNAGSNTIAVDCNRGVAQETCRLNFDVIQVGGTSFDTCAPTQAKPGWTRLFDGTFASFDGWRKSGGGGFGRQADCTIRGFRGTGVTWTTAQQSGPHTLEVDWQRTAAGDTSVLYLASPSRATAGSIAVPIGAGTPSVGNAVGAWNTTRVEVTASAVRVYLNGTLIETRGAPSTTSGSVGLQNPSSNDGIRFKNIQVFDDYELGTLTGPAVRARVADGTVNVGGESTLANLVAQAQRATTTAAPANTRLSFVSPNALQADLTGTAATYKQALAVQPSTTDMRNMRLTGTQIEAVLEQQWRDGGFVRLGTSTGFRYTYDPTQSQGSRITGMWLDNVAIKPTDSVSVTVSSSLNGGGDGFTGFAAGTSKRAANKTERAALLEYLESFDAAPVPVDGAQHSVGVTTPNGTTVVAGGTLSVDLSSLAFSGATDPKDATLAVALNGQPLGTPVPVDASIGAAPTDEYGTAAVRAIVPAATPAGPATLTISGASTGTVTVPITVTAPPVTVVDSTTTLGVAPMATTVRQGTTSVSVTVAKSGGVPTGQVEIWVGGAKQSTATLVGGRATARIAAFPTVGTRTIQARYLGDATTRASASAVATVSVAKAKPQLTAKVAPGKVLAKKTKAKVTVTVAATGFVPGGKVSVKVGKKTYVGTLRAGKVTITLAKFPKPGRVKATVTYAGDALAAAGSTTATIVVKKAKK